MGDIMDKDDKCNGCYYYERSYTVAPCNECSVAFSGMQTNWYVKEEMGKSVMDNMKVVEDKGAWSNPFEEHWNDSAWEGKFDKYQEQMNAYMKSQRHKDQLTKEVGDIAAWSNPFEEEQVKHPKHYKLCNMEAIDVIKATLTKEQFNGYVLGNILKYRLRAGKKGDTQEDIHKALQYEEMWDMYND